MNTKRLLEQVPIDPAGEERAWAVGRAAYARHEPVRTRRRLPVVAAVALGALVAAAFSPPGRAVVDAVRRSIGIEHAAPALFRLPAPGRLLVSGSAGTWVVSADGSKRRLGDYEQASWSPHGLFVVVARSNELAAVEPGTGKVHWSLARRRVSFPRWGGSRTDTRIAYLTTSRLHVVAGDGTDDVDVQGLPAAAQVAPAWRPGDRHVLAYATARGRVTVLDVDEGSVSWVSRRLGAVRALVWSRDGRTLVAATARSLVRFDGTSGREHVLPVPGVEALAFAGRGALVALRGATVLAIEGTRVRTLFGAPGPLHGLAASPDGSWLVTALPGADQWIFVGRRRVLAVSHIEHQLGGGVQLDGWMPDA